MVLDTILVRSTYTLYEFKTNKNYVCTVKTHKIILSINQSIFISIIFIILFLINLSVHLPMSKREMLERKVEQL